MTRIEVTQDKISVDTECWRDAWLLVKLYSAYRGWIPLTFEGKEPEPPNRDIESSGTP